MNQDVHNDAGGLRDISMNKFDTPSGDISYNDSTGLLNVTNQFTLSSDTTWTRQSGGAPVDLNGTSPHNSPLGPYYCDYAENNNFNI